MHYLCPAHMLDAPRYDVYVHDGMNRDCPIASTQKTAKTDVLGCRRLFEVSALRIFAPKFQRHTQPHAHLAPGKMAGSPAHSSKESLKSLQIQGLSHEPCPAHLFTFFLVF